MGVHLRLAAFNSLTPTAPRCLSRLVCDPVRCPSPSQPFAPWETVDAFCSTAVERKELMSDFKGLQADRADIQPFRGGNPTARFLRRVRAVARRRPAFPRSCRRSGSAQTGRGRVHIRARHGTPPRALGSALRYGAYGVLHAGSPLPPIWRQPTTRRRAARGHDGRCPEELAAGEGRRDIPAMAGRGDERSRESVGARFGARGDPATPK